MNNCDLPYLRTLPSGAKIAIEQFDSQAVTSHATKREMQRATWHNLARKLLEDPAATFTYSEVGAPQIVGSPLFLGVSHSASLIAVIVAPHPCAIDIESLDRNFERIESRYISSAERPLIQEPHHRALIWSIKECLYKYSGRKGLTLLSDIRVKALTGKMFTGSIAPHAEQISGEAIICFGHSLAFIG